MITDLMPLDAFSMLREIDRMLDRPSAPSRWLPRIDVFDRDTDLVIRIEVAGVDPDAVDVTVEDRTLTISGTRSLDESFESAGFHRREIFTGEFTRTLVLPDGLDPTEISAKANNGIIEVRVPRRPEVLPRKVKVDISES